MVSLKEIQAENKRLRNLQKKLREAEKANDARKKLLKENKKLSRELKYGKALGVGRKASSIAAKVGKRTGVAFGKKSVSAVRGLQKYANFLAEQERKQKSVNRKLKSAKKTKRRQRL